VIRVEAPLDVVMPRVCCRCAALGGVDLIDMRLPTDFRRWRVRVPYCAPCLYQERRNKLLFRGLLVVAVFAMFQVDLAPAVRGSLLSAALGLWMAYPHLANRPLRLLHVDDNRVAIFACANHTFANQLLLVPGARSPDTDGWS